MEGNDILRVALHTFRQIVVYGFRIVLFSLRDALRGHAVIFMIEDVDRGDPGDVLLDHDLSLFFGKMGSMLDGIHSCSKAAFNGTAVSCVDLDLHAETMRFLRSEADLFFGELIAAVSLTGEQFDPGCSVFLVETDRFSYIVDTVHFLDRVVNGGGSAVTSRHADPHKAGEYSGCLDPAAGSSFIESYSQSVSGAGIPDGGDAVAERLFHFLSCIQGAQRNAAVIPHESRILTPSEVGVKVDHSGDQSASVRLYDRFLRTISQKIRRFPDLPDHTVLNQNGFVFQDDKSFACSDAFRYNDHGRTPSVTCIFFC